MSTFRTIAAAVIAVAGLASFAFSALDAPATAPAIERKAVAALENYGD